MSPKYMIIIKKTPEYKTGASLGYNTFYGFIKGVVKYRRSLDKISINFR